LATVLKGFTENRTWFRRSRRVSVKAGSHHTFYQTLTAFDNSKRRLLNYLEERKSGHHSFHGGIILKGSELPKNQTLNINLLTIGIF
jgi:hypothetical protein